MNENLLPTIKELKKLKDNLEQGNINSLSDNWNNLSYSINQLVIKSGLEEHKETNIFIRPMKGRISAPFGEKRTNSKGQIYYHTGIDIADNPANKTPILAASDGVVIYTGNANDGYGNKVVINHGDGLKTLYAHCSVLQVKTGDQVKQSLQIAIVGSTGHSTGPHLHFEIIKNGKVQNPTEYIKDA